MNEIMEKQKPLRYRVWFETIDTPRTLSWYEDSATREHAEFRLSETNRLYKSIRGIRIDEIRI
jgi:hypothetical protein